MKNLQFNKFNNHLGYTLVELLSCILLITIVVSTAVPAYSAIVTRQKITTSLGAFHHSVMLARYESAISNQFVAICPSLDGKNCSDNGFDFSHGWISFRNLDRDYPIKRDIDEKLVESINLDSTDFRLIANRKTFTFRPASKRNTNGTLMLCPKQETNSKLSHQAVIISYTGRPRMDKNPKKNHLKICSKQINE